jgi:SAM-dependent methyltransferase
VSFSNEWDERYQENTHMSIWPWSDLVSLVMKYKPQKERFKVLELGCGYGANIPLFSSLGVDYYAVDGSETIVRKLHQKYPQYNDNIFVGDFTQSIPDQKFDLIIDRAALTHNSEQAIKESLNACHKQLIDGGKFIGVDWFSDQCSDYAKGEMTEDIWTKSNFNESHFSDVGKTHFSNEEHLLGLFEKFKILSMTHKISSEKIPNNDWTLATWNFVAEKVV